MSNKQIIILKQPFRYVPRNSYRKNFSQKQPRRSVTFAKLRDLIKPVNLQKLLSIVDLFFWKEYILCNSGNNCPLRRAVSFLRIKLQNKITEKKTFNILIHILKESEINGIDTSKFKKTTWLAKVYLLTMMSSNL